MFQDGRIPELFHSILGSWYESVRKPAEFQKQVLLRLTEDYTKTRYGRNHISSATEEISDFRTKFPIINYRGLDPYLADIKKGDYSSFLPEPLVCWVMTRGSTGPSKVLPATKTHLEQIFTCGARALANHVSRTKDFDLLKGNILNLNFPSSVHTVFMGNREMPYGYSSGTYARLNPMLNELSLLPRQEEIDALGPGISRTDWEERFELAYQKALGKNLTGAMGVTPVILSFARYVKKKHGKNPKDIWNPHALFCTSVKKIQYRYAPILRKYFGEIPVVEIYSATEGVFAQQVDELPYITPNYDKYLFEVQTGSRTIMLHELKRGEWGKLIISSCMFPRYDIGDMIESAGNNYFRVFGRHGTLTVLEHRIYRLLFRWFI